MRQLTNEEFTRVSLLTENSIDHSFLEPTKTGLEKSILDATGPFRNFLKEKDLHDYSIQKQGQENKVQIDAYFITPQGLQPSVASLYRPNTKKGDPRIWFKKLPNYCNANDILGVFEFERTLYVINITELNIHELLHPLSNNPLVDIVNAINQNSNIVAEELLKRLRKISAEGFQASLLNADTSIGRTLEHLLGIPMNCSKQPDFKGIELKSARENKGTRKGLFAKTPNWTISKFKNRQEILDSFGYWEKGIFRLYTTVRGTGRNAQGLMLRTDYDKDLLFENSDNPEIGDFLTWELNDLKKCLSEKHKETFWISAQTKVEDGKEYFLFNSAIHTKKPLVNQFGLLIEMGVITLDYPIKRLEDGSVIDKGCNFKLKHNALNLLFPPSQKYSLLP